jgi:hypothetical protein
VAFYRFCGVKHPLFNGRVAHHVNGKHAGCSTV